MDNDHRILEMLDDVENGKSLNILGITVLRISKIKLTRSYVLIIIFYTIFQYLANQMEIILIKVMI